MHRRRLLAAAVAGGSALLAGCYSGNGDPEDTDGETTRATFEGPEPSVTFGTEVTGVSEAEGGALAVRILVVNRTETSREATLTVTARAESDTQTRSTDVTVPPETETTATVVFDALTYDAFLEDGAVRSVEVS